MSLVRALSVVVVMAGGSGSEGVGECSGSVGWEPLTRSAPLWRQEQTRRGRARPGRFYLISSM